MSAAVSFYGSRYQQETPTAPTSLTSVTRVQQTGVKQRMGTATIRQLLEARTPNHQSPLQQNRVRRIANAFDAAKLDVFKVSIDGDGVWWLEDGQHRANAAMVAGHSDLEVFVLFVSGLDSRETAEFFLGINDRKNKPAGALIQARAEAGDLGAEQMFAVASRHGFSIKMLHSSDKDAGDVIGCPDVLLGIIERIGADHLDDVVGIVRRAWNGSPGSTQDEIFRGISQFVLAYPEINAAQLADKLGSVSPEILKTEMALARVSERSSSQLRKGYSTGRGVLAIWNQWKKRQRLEDRFNQYHADRLAAAKKSKTADASVVR